MAPGNTGSGVRGDVLRLMPHDDSAPIRLVARAQFRIGRSIHHADLITRIQPDTPENDERTNLLGRIHVFGEIIDGHPTLRDGNGTGPSMNGSTFGGNPLTSSAPMQVERRGVLTLGEHFSVVVIPRLDATGGLHFENGSGPSDAAHTPRGAITFGPTTAEPTLLDAVWLFTRVDFALRPGGSPAWLPPADGNPGSFLHRGGCFWLCNASLPHHAVQSGDHPIDHGYAAPLDPSVPLRLGTKYYSVEIE